MNRHTVRRHTELTEAVAGDRGASFIEYVLLLSLIVLVCLASLTAFGGGVSDNVDDSASRVVTAGGGSYDG